MSKVEVIYRASSARIQAVLVAIAALMSAGLTVAALWALLDPGGIAATIALVLIAPLSWWMVARFRRALRARKAAIAAGRAAIVADAGGFAYLDWQGESRRLDWRAIHGFRIVDLVDEGPQLYVDGSYPNAGIQPIHFALAALDADRECLLRDLERLRQAALPVLPG